MDTEILKAFIAAGGAIGAGAAGAVGKALFDRRRLVSVSTTRRDALNGTWVGEIENINVPSDPPPPFKADITCHFSAHWKLVTGDGNFIRDGIPHVVTFRGGFKDDHYLRLAYEHQSPLFAFGHMIVFLDDYGTSIKGKAVGYGGIRGERGGKIIVGTIKLKKKLS